MSQRQGRRLRPIRLLTNKFWGLRSGTITKTGERVFKMKRWKAAICAGERPSNKTRTYKNPKLYRLGHLGSAVFAKKGARTATL